MDQGSNKNHSPAYNFTPTVTKFCVMWEGLSLPHDTKFGNCRRKIVDSRSFHSWSLIHGLRWSGLIKVGPGKQVISRKVQISQCSICINFVIFSWKHGPWYRDVCYVVEDSVFKIQSTIRFSCHQNDISQHWFLPWLVITWESHLQIKHWWISHNQVMSIGSILSAYQTTISYQSICNFMFFMKLNLKNWTLSTFLKCIKMFLT